VFCGATVNTEYKYSFAINGTPAPIPIDLTGLEFFTTNNSENNAKRIQPNDKILSYLYFNAIHYFRVSF